MTTRPFILGTARRRNEKHRKRHTVVGRSATPNMHSKHGPAYSTRGRIFRLCEIADSSCSCRSCDIVQN